MTEVVIKTFDRQDPRLGRIVQHDPRSRQYAFKAPARVALVSKRHHRWIEVLDQGNLGSCTGNAGTGALGSDPLFPTLVPHYVAASELNESAAVKLYSEATAIDEWAGEYPPEDTGSSGLAIAKVLKARGWISGYQHTFTFEDMQAALQNGPVLLGIAWYEDFYYPDSDANLFINGSTVVGGHEIVVDEIDMEKQRFGFTNSWGDSYGENGRAYIPFDLMKRLLSEDGDVVVLVPLDQPAPVPTPSDPVEEDIAVVDALLWDQVKVWANAKHYSSNKRAAKAVKDWAQKKGLTS